MKDSILFSGDSYTWGEGLQLYIENDFWISQRNENNEWGNLQKKLTPESEKFREENRFAGIVSNHFKCKSIVRDKNGGQFEYPIDFVESIIETNQVNNIKFLIFQLTGLERVNLHLMTGCDCDFCVNSDSDKPHFFLIKLLHKKLENKPFTKKEKIAIKYLKDNFDIDFYKLLELNEDIFSSDLYTDFYSKYFYQNVEKFIKEYVNKWKTYFPVYFIDSWSPTSSKVLLSYPEIYDNTIPLLGGDGGYYKEWDVFMNTFEYQMIKNEFKKTNNFHPTLLQHKNVAKSIITYVENNYIESKEKII